MMAGLGNNLFKNINILKISASASSAASSSGVSVIDMAGYEGCLILANLGTVATTVVEMYLTNGPTTGTLVTRDGSTVYSTGTSGQMAIDVWQPEDRYLSPVWNISTGDYLRGVHAIQYAPKKAPISPSTHCFLSSIAYASLVTPTTDA